MPKKVITSISILLLIGLGIILCSNNYIPREAPVPIVKYNNVTVPTIESMYNWLNKENGGNSNLIPPPEESTKDLTAIAVKPNSNIIIRFDTKYQPKQMEIIHWFQGKIESRLILNDKIFRTPTVPGIYVYEIIGRWDDTHESAHSFRIEVK